MPGCVLRASGSTFDVESFLRNSAFRTEAVYRKGQRRRPASRGSQAASGFNVVVSERDDSMEAQINDALAFLRAHREDLRGLRAAPGVESVVLDFACPQGEIANRSARFPAELLNAAGAADIDIHVSFYLVG
jgi:hypothetical protein